MMILAILILALFFTGLFYLKCLSWKAIQWPNAELKLPLFQSHRGYWKSGARENTLDAFSAARKNGSKMAELDTLPALNCEPVVFHDFSLKRIFNQDLRIDSLSGEELVKQFQIPSLHSVLESKEAPDFINIEIKTEKFFDFGFERRLAEVIQQAKAQDRIIFSSFNPLALYRISKFLPKVPRALLVTDLNGDPDSKIFLRKMWLGGFAKVHMVNADHRMINEAFMQTMKQRSIPVAAWTVNDPNRANELRALGVVSIITDLEKI